MSRNERAAVPEDEEERQGLLEAQPSQQLPSPNSPGSATNQAAQLKAQPSDAVGICRICLEEDAVTNLEAPCKCSGTQRHAHHACIQRWVDEKGNAKCEICEQPYGPPGSYTVPPAPTPMLENMPLFTPMYILEASDSRTRGGLDLYDTDSALQRNPTVSWCISFIVFFMFLVVLHHTLIVADNMDYDPSGPSGSGSAPAPGAPMPDNDDGDDVASNLLLFLFWVATKAILIGIPLYTVMRVASRQARREQYEAMMRAGNGYDGRRMVIRVRGADQPVATAV